MHEATRRPAILLVLLAAAAFHAGTAANAECTVNKPSFHIQSLGGRVYSGNKLDVSIMPADGAPLASVAIVVDNQLVLTVPAAELEPRAGGWLGLVKEYQVGEARPDTVRLGIDVSGSIRIEATDTTGHCVRTDGQTTWQTGSTDTFAVIVGINDYPNANAKLSYARQDAEAVARYVRKYFNVSSPTRLYLLTDPWVATAEEPTDDLAEYRNDATRDNILDALSDVHDHIDADGKLIFYFAGHGFTSTDHQTFSSIYYLLARDSLLQRDTRMIAFQDIAGRMARSGANQAVLIFDACFSDRFVAGFSTPPTVYGRALSGTIRNPSIDNYASTNVYLMTAGTDDDLAYEPTTLQHGIFTHQLLNAYKSLQADGKELTMYQAFRYARKQVPLLLPQYMPGKRQRPNHHLIGGADEIVWWQQVTP